MIFFTRRVWPPQTHRCAMALPPLLSALREGLLHDHYDHCDHHNHHHQQLGMDGEGVFMGRGKAKNLRGRDLNLRGGAGNILCISVNHMPQQRKPSFALHKVNLSKS